MLENNFSRLFSKRRPKSFIKNDCAILYMNPVVKMIIESTWCEKPHCQRSTQKAKSVFGLCDMINSDKQLTRTH